MFLSQYWKNEVQTNENWKFFELGEISTENRFTAVFKFVSWKMLTL